jgi:hypothetical protein
MAFQPPNIVPLRQPYTTLTKSIDDLFNAYQTGQLQQAQLKSTQLQQQAAEGQLASQQLQDRANFGGYSAQEVAPYAQQAAQPQPADQLEDQHVAALRSFFDRIRMGQQVAAQQAQAGLSKAQGEARIANMEADLLGAPPAPGQAPTANASGPGVVQNVLEAVKAGQMSPNQADDYLGRNPKVHLAYINALAQQGVDVAALQNKYDKSKATANFEGGQNVQEPARLVESVKAGLPGLEQVAKSAGVTDKPYWNSIKQTWNRLTGGVASQSYATQLGEIRSQVAQILQAHGAPSEAATERAGHMIPDNIGMSQLHAVLTEDVPNLISARADALQGKPIASSAAAPKPTAGTHEVVLQDASGARKTAIYNGPKFVRFK